MTGATRFPANAELQRSKMEKSIKQKAEMRPLRAPDDQLIVPTAKWIIKVGGSVTHITPLDPLLTAPRKRSRTRHKFSIPRRDAPELYLILPSRREGAGNA